MRVHRRTKRRSWLLEITTTVRVAAELALGVAGVVAIAVQGAPGAPGAHAAAPPAAETVALAAPSVHISADALIDAPELAALAAPDDAVLTMLAEALAGRLTETRRVARGATVARLLADAGVAADDRAAAARALHEVFDPRELRAGQDITLYLARAEDASEARLVGMAFEPVAERMVHVARQADGGYRARDFTTPLTPRLTRLEGEITESLYVDATRAGAQPSTIAEIANLLAFSVDFQREIHPGDRFEMLYEEWVDPTGQVVRAGDLYYVAFSPSGRDLEFWRYVNEDDEVEFFDLAGESARRFLMRTPINGARLSSGYGSRRHPISGYTRMHRGTDFAASSGTRIYAAGDGVIERANRYGGYGNYVRIRHANGFKTAYAHMSRFARGMRAGRRVRQGEVIGYVGTTGASTGPHLHYEIIRNGSHINPMSMDLPTGRTLEESERAGFDVERARINALRARLADEPDEGAGGGAIAIAAAQP